jgi:hypothetical protein
MNNHICPAEVFLGIVTAFVEEKCIDDNVHIVTVIQMELIHVPNFAVWEKINL